MRFCCLFFVPSNGRPPGANLLLPRSVQLKVHETEIAAPEFLLRVCLIVETDAPICYRERMKRNYAALSGEIAAGMMFAPCSGHARGF
jgi:hypothetical protein